MARQPIPEEDHERFLELHAQGYGRNRIARELGFPPVQISRTAEFLGVTFDRSRIEAATKARMADLAERRALLAEDLIEDAERLRAQMWEPTVVYSFGGKDNTYEDHEFDEAPAAEKRALMATAGMAIDRSLKLAPVHEADGADTERSMLDNLAAGIAALAAQNAAQRASDPSGTEA